MTKIELEKELINSLLEAFDERADQLGYKGKAYITLQHEFMLGAVCAIDKFNKATGSCIRPYMWVAIIRGEKITKVEL